MSAEQDNVLALFDAAVAAELPKVSELEYNSNSICRMFAADLRKHIAALSSAGAEQEGWVMVPIEVAENARRFVANGYRGPLHGAKSVFDWVHSLAAQPTPQEKA